MKKAGVDIGRRIHHGLLQLLDQYKECTPPCGAYKGQQQFEKNGFQQISPKPHPKPKGLINPKAKADPKQLSFDFDPGEFYEAS